MFFLVEVPHPDHRLLPAYPSDTAGWSVVAAWSYRDVLFSFVSACGWLVFQRSVAGPTILSKTNETKY